MLAPIWKETTEKRRKVTRRPIGCIGSSLWVMLLVLCAKRCGDETVSDAHTRYGP